MARTGGNIETTPRGHTLPLGVQWRPLHMHHDARGALTEIFRASWDVGLDPVQWNAVTSAAGVLRGVHVHIKHADYLLIVQGRARIGLRDLRPGSPTEGSTALIEMRGDPLTALSIPPGVAHGFYFPEPSLHIYAVSAYWDVADELGCHWADPALAIPWGITAPSLSARDAALPPLGALAGRVPPWQAA